MSEKHGGFAETAKKDWILAAGKELGDDKPLEKLSRRRGDLTLLPYYDASDLPPGAPSQIVRHGQQWVNAPRVVAQDARVANRAALQHLQAGANGILFEIKGNSVDPEHLFSGIELPFCSTFLYGNVSTGFLRSFSAYATSHFDPKEVQGAAYGLSVDTFAQSLDAFKEFSQFKTLGLTVDTPPLELDALSNVMNEIHARHSQSGDITQLRPTAVLLSLSDDFFGEIIRIRALDLLWSCYSAAYGQAADLFTHCWSAPKPDPALEPHGNMIASTSRAISALVGGAHAISIDPEVQGSLGDRIARNVSFIADEEAYLSRARTPVLGSYFIESCARQLAEEAWAQFQTKVRS